MTIVIKMDSTLIIMKEKLKGEPETTYHTPIMISNDKLKPYL